VIDEAGKAQTFFFVQHGFITGQIQTCRAFTALPASGETFHVFEISIHRI
jgi:hypothetical protein